MPRNSTPLSYLSNRLAAICAVCIVIFSINSAVAESVGGPGGRWPKTWPKALEQHRERAWTWLEGKFEIPCYDIAFSNRESFEAAWPHILKLKGAGAKLTLRQGPHVRVWNSKPAKSKTAGVIICPVLKGVTVESALENEICLVVDGRIVDLNRIHIPANTLINDMRFPDVKKKSSSDQP